MENKIYVYVGASWCPKCNVYEPKFVEYCKQNNIEFKVIDADKDESSDFIAKQGIRNIPIVVELDKDHQDEKGKILDVVSFIQ